MDRRRETQLRAGQERLDLPARDRGGRERGVREEDIPLSPAYLDGHPYMRDTGMTPGRDPMVDPRPPVRRMKSGGAVRGDGCCSRGHTKGRHV